MRRRFALTASLVALALAASAPAALAGPFERVYQDFKGDGVIDGCNYSDGELQSAAGQIPPDIEQYAPAFAEALAAAREKRASGACDPTPKKKEPEPEPAPAAPAPPPERPAGPKPRPAAPRIAEPPAPAPQARAVLASDVRPPAVDTTGTVATGADAPTPVWLLAALAVAALLAALGGLLAWVFGWSPERYTRPLAASAAEAGGRTADVAGEFWDWVRLGR